nr:tRNA (N6-threonylcarbamoyladenosine(37)-N6)-methyltransferase TrmO [Dehalococcoides mccartyi]
MNVQMKPIGTVINAITQKPEQTFKWEDVVSEIHLKPELVEGLTRIEEFSHLNIIWSPHQSPPEGMALLVYPRGQTEFGKVGVFASRSPFRPNPIAKTLVRLLEHKGNVLKVKGLDAINGTPVLDIKPFITDYDSDKEATVAPWIKKT